MVWVNPPNRCHYSVVRHTPQSSTPPAYKCSTLCGSCVAEKCKDALFASRCRGACLLANPFGVLTGTCLMRLPALSDSRTGHVACGRRQPPLHSKFARSLSSIG